MKKTAFLLLIIFCVCNIYSQTPAVKWTKYVRTHNDGEGFYDLKPTSDKGFIAVGSDSIFEFNRSAILNKRLGNEPWIVKLDSAGNTVWQRTPGIYESGLTSVVQSSDGGFVAAGFDRDPSPPYDLSRFHILKYSAAGNLVWQKYYGGTAEDVAYCIDKTSAGGFVVAGYTKSNDGDVTGNHSPGTADVWLMQLSAGGNIIWKKCFGGTGQDTAFAVIQTPDKGFVIAGSSTSNNGDLTGNNGLTDAWLFKTDSLGNLLWQNNFGGANADGFRDLVLNADGSFTITGFSRSSTATSNGNKGNADLWVARISSSGTIIWSKGFGGAEDEMGFSISSTQDNNYLVTGFTESIDTDVSGNNGLADAWVIKVSDIGNLVWQKCDGTARNDFAFAGGYITESDYAISGFAVPASAPSDPLDAFVTRLGNTSYLKVLFNSAYTVNQGLVQAIKPNMQFSATPLNGFVFMSIDTGQYTISFSYNPNYTVTPPTINLNVPNYFDTAVVTFTLTPVPGTRDLSISAVPLVLARPGFQLRYKLFYKNNGTDTILNGQVLFKRDTRLNFISAMPPISSTNGDTLKWNFSNLKPFDSASITINMQVQSPPAVNIGDTLSSLALILPIIGDQTPSDDSSIIRQIVIGSYDPNDKTENFSGKISTQQVSSGAYINYIIRFQNTGNDTAFNIVVRDTLDAKLDWNSLQMIGSSHVYNMQIVSQNRIAWTFSNIKLVDSIHNEPASHGFIAYRIKAKNNLLVGDIIKNSASIYFDYNLPVKTNTQNTIVAIAAIAPPTISSFTPTTAGTGTTITITGTNFTGASVVSFGSVAASSFTVNSATTISAVVGAGTTGNVSVTTPGGTATLAGFTFIAPPTISSFTPTSAGTGATITITGTNFTGASVVSFGGVAASSFTVNSATTISAVVGAGANGNVSVTTPGGTATLAGFTFLAPPTISSFTPTTAGTGATITITGTNFTGASVVSFGGVAANSFTVNSATTISAVVGAGATGNVSVTTPGGTATLAGFTFIAPPTISSFTPISAGTGATITITGTNFTGASVVSFGGVAASSFTVNSATTISAAIGAGATGNVSVTTPGGTATLAGFTFVAAPTITSFTPISAGTGATITITGTNFTGATLVSFGGVAATTFNVNSATSISAVVGAGATGYVSVTTPGGIGILGGFTFIVVTSVGSPNGNSKDLVVYPNPAMDFIIIKHPASTRTSQLKWIDMLGRTVMIVRVSRNITETGVNIKSLPPGAYKILWTDEKELLGRSMIVY